MKRLIILWVVMAALSACVVYAKRKAPEKVDPVIQNGTEYRAAKGHMGHVEAWDTKSKQMIWRRQIYVVKYTVGLERDVQDVFIKTIELKGNILIVKNERKSEYELNLESLEVKVVKGSLIENRK